MSLPAPEPSLRVSVVVPAKDEEALIGRCLEALASQDGIGYEEYEVLLVLDRCSDGTEGRAREVAKRHPRLRLRFLEGPGEGVGHARRAGMEAAYGRLMETIGPDGLIASTDADSTVEAAWLSAQLALVGEGARAIGGRIELEDDGRFLPEGALAWYEEQGLSRYRRVLSTGADSPPEHWQFSGASLSLTARTYREIGGLPPRADLEDEYLERALEEKGVWISRSSSVKVTTSARTRGRARRGLAHDLSLASRASRNDQGQGVGSSE